MKAKTEMLENGNLLGIIPMDLKNRGNGKTIAFDGEDTDEARRQVEAVSGGVFRPKRESPQVRDLRAEKRPQASLGGCGLKRSGPQQSWTLRAS